jgi:hypothetical protein
MLLAAIVAAMPGLSGQGGQQPPREDTLSTSVGDLVLTFLGHGTLMFRQGGTVVHIDPVGREADYTTLPKADLILVTHEHGDHLDPDAIAAIRKESTRIVVSRSCEGRIDGAVVMENGDVRTEAGVGIEAVPAYNVVHMRASGQPYHPRGNGNGYILTFGDTRVYVAGDTEDTPEMVADAARTFRPRILYPYHYGDTDPQELVKLLAGEAGIEVRVRELR